MSKESSLTKEQKKGRLLLVICFIVVMILCGGLGYFLGTSDLINPKEVMQENENNTKEVEKKELKDVEVDEFMVSLLDKMNTADNCNTMSSLNYYTDKKFTVSDISKEHAQLIMLYNLRKKGYEFRENNWFTSDVVHEIIKSTLGKEYDYVDESINYCPAITYDSSTGKYVFGVNACGGSCGPQTVRKVLAAKRSDDIIELTIGVIFGPKGDDTKFYSDYERTNVIIDLADKAIDGNEVTDADYEKGAKYKMTFKNEDGNYVFVSSEPIK